MKPVLRLRLHATQSQPCFPAFSNVLARPSGTRIFAPMPTERVTHIAKKHKKMPEEKAAVAKQKKQQRRAKRKKEARNNLTPEEIFYDDRFFFIAGHTTGGAPYGVTWLPVVTYVEILIYKRASLDRCFGTFALKRFLNHRYGDHHCRVGIFLKALIILSFAARATGGMIHTYI